MVSRHLAQVLTEPWRGGLTLEVENGHSVRALRVGDEWPRCQSCSRWCLCLPSLPQGAAPQVLTGPHLHVLLLGQAAFLPESLLF